MKAADLREARSFAGALAARLSQMWNDQLDEIVTIGGQAYHIAWPDEYERFGLIRCDPTTVLVRRQSDGQWLAVEIRARARHISSPAVEHDSLGGAA